jgi:hypothetical protein
LAEVLTAEHHRRVWHRAASTVGFDERVAAELDAEHPAQRWRAENLGAGEMPGAMIILSVDGGEPTRT